MPNPTKDEKAATPATANGNNDVKVKAKATPRPKPVMVEEADEIPATSRGGHWDEFILNRVEQARELGGESKAGVFHETSPTTSSYINKTYNSGGKKEARLERVLGVKGRVTASIRHTRDVEIDDEDNPGKTKTVKRGTMFVKVFLDESELAG